MDFRIYMIFVLVLLGCKLQGATVFVISQKSYALLCLLREQG